MDTLHMLFSVGFVNVFGAMTFALLLSGIVIGVVAGALPGISFVNAMALALPFTYVMDPATAIVFLTGIYVGGVFGGSISSILINIPGSPASLPATWDGYPMTKQGKSARALGIAITCSAIGGVFSALVMTFLSPPFAKFALRFDQPEFFAATVLGLVSVVAIAQGRMLSSLVSLLFGLAVGAVGLDPMYGVPRLTFGSAVLENGISFVVVLIGMFAISEVLNWIGKRDKINVAQGIHASTELPRPRDIFRLKGAIARGAGIGAMIGAVPGAGAVVGAVISYGVEKQSSKDRERFGQGVEAGLAAPETAKNATTGTATIPLLTLGIPGSAATAIMLAALVVQGVQPGPMLFVSSADLVYTVFAGYLVANFLMIVVGLGVARGFAQIIRIPPAILFGFIVVLCVVGAFGLRNNIADVYICVAFGLIGYVLQRFDIPSAPLVLGVILGPLAERYFRTAMIAADNDITIFVRRPYSGTILALSLGFMIWALWPSIKRLLSREQRAADGAALSRGEPEQVPKAR